MNHPLQRLHVRLAKTSVRRVDAVLEDSRSLSSYGLRSGLGFDGRLYVAPPKQSPPDWLRFVQTGIDEELREISNRSNAAVLMLRHAGRIFAITFGHGRHLLRHDLLEPDFGLKAALNGLRHDSLRSLDSFAVEEQVVQKRAQASRASGLEVFGVDVSKDMLTAVTGVPREDVALQAISGTGGTLAISVHADFEGLGAVIELLLRLYRARRYRTHFRWVDNVRRVTDGSVVNDLNELLLEDLCSNDPQAYLAPPEPLEWDRISKFGYSRARRQRDLDMSLSTYLQNVRTDELSVELLGRHKVKAYGDENEPPVASWTVFKCLVYEVRRARQRLILAAGQWFFVDQDFADEIQSALERIPGARVPLPTVLVDEDGKLEAEPDYNDRVAREVPTLALLDRKPARCRGTTTGIEVCDLLTDGLDMIHVKHRKGGSSSLSHLFAQGRMAGEALLRDEGFRRDARRYLRELRASWERRIPVGKPDPGNYRVVYAILGDGRRRGLVGLPFFSQLNLVRSYEALTALGYPVAAVTVPAAA